MFINNLNNNNNNNNNNTKYLDLDVKFRKITEARN